ncbi:Na(+)-translocating NADH-quinone reductase subunit C [Chlamydiales bacterium STE3]|nr:Na(+)-translocating NADH-quinone reductase subunit C [Chlamydiales bacterium STE3]
MSEQQRRKEFSNNQVILFMIVLSFVCALILSVLASTLAKPKEVAKELDRSKQMMIASKVLSHDGYFLVKNAQGEYIPAKYDQGTLVSDQSKVFATQEQLIEIYKKRFVPLLVNKQGDIKTFQELGLNEDRYVSEFKKSGYYKEPWMLIYKIVGNNKQDEKVDNAEGYVIPINGYGLWDAIYGYLAIKIDGDTVIGASWYDQKETPGLGANIAEAYWQNLFPGKKIFQQGSSGQTDFKTAPLGITVVKGKVSEVLGNSPKAMSAVDGMTGATLTGNGVTDAYRQVLDPYRAFLIKLNESSEKKSTT